MSILTKTFVVLVTICSIVLVALVVPFVATQDDLTRQLQDAKNAHLAAEKAAAMLESELTVARSGNSATIQSLNQTIASLNAQIETEKAARVLAQADAQAAKANMIELKADFTGLNGAMQEQVKTNQLLTTQLTKAQETIQTQGTRILQLADALDAETSQVQTLTRNVRRLNESMVDVRDQLETAQAQLALVPAEVRQQYIEGDQVVVASGPTEPVVGQIVAVDDQGDGVILVQVNVGESDGIKQGMKFLVHQGSEFKGTLIISNVDRRESVGRMELVKVSPVKGDAVYAGPY